MMSSHDVTLWCTVRCLCIVQFCTEYWAGW